MKTIALDMAGKDDLLLDVQKNVVSFKSGDTDQRFCLALFDGAKEWVIPKDALLSVWYSGPGGEGCYSDIDGETAFSVSGNTVTITPAPEMLSVSGSGLMCLVVHDTQSQRVLWNLVYTVEGVPAADSSGASGYFAAFTGLIRQAQQFIVAQDPDATLSHAGKAADAAATGAALNGKASSGLISQTFYKTSLVDLEASLAEVFNSMAIGTMKLIESDLTSGTAEVPSGYWFITIAKRSANLGYVEMKSIVGGMVRREIIESIWGAWEWVTPPLAAGVEYRTTERWNGKPVYAWLIDAGALPNTSMKAVYFSKSASTVDEVVFCEGSTNGGMRLPNIVPTATACVYLASGKGYVNITTGTDRSGSTAKVLVKYTKTTD